MKNAILQRIFQMSFSLCRTTTPTTTTTETTAPTTNATPATTTTARRARIQLMTVWCQITPAPSTTAASATDAALMATLRFNLRSTTNIGLDAPPGCVPCASSPRWLLEHRPFFDLDPAHLYGGALLVLAAFRRATPLSAAFGLRPRRLPALMWVRVRRRPPQHRGRCCACSRARRSPP